MDLKVQGKRRRRKKNFFFVSLASKKEETPTVVKIKKRNFSITTQLRWNQIIEGNMSQQKDK